VDPAAEEEEKDA
jgi:hypothetical protein